jgi:tetratricopeptide (TPR) repeat protein
MMTVDEELKRISRWVKSENYLKAQKKLDKLVRKHPRDSSILGISSMVYLALGNIKKAKLMLSNALKIDPQNHALMHSLAEIYSQEKYFDKAKEQLERAVQLGPENPTYLGSLARCYYKLAEFSNSKKYFKRAVSLMPNNDFYWTGLAVVYMHLSEHDDGLIAADRAVELNPNSANAYNTRGAIFRDLGDYKAAEADFERAIELVPNVASYYSNVAVCLMRYNPVAAIKHLRHALKLDRTFKDAGWNLSHCLLSIGYLKEGWQAYEFRKVSEHTVGRILPKWDGGPYAAGELLIRSEQGVGDHIRYIQCVSDLVAEHGPCVVQCDPRLISLFKRSFSDEIAWTGGRIVANNKIEDQPQISRETFLGDLPAIYRPDIESFPNRTSYLVADPQRVIYWKKYIRQLPGKVKVGMCWRTGNLTGGRKAAHATIEQWQPIFENKDATFINLFYDECAEELNSIKQKFGVTIHTPSGIHLKNDMDDLAALMVALDLVISVSSSVLDLAGALHDTCTWELTFRDEDERFWQYCGEKYNPWSPTIKPIYAAGHDSCLILAAEELKKITQSKDPVNQLEQTANVLFAYYIPEENLLEAS